jgi:hypothetical protein
MADNAATPTAPSGTETAVSAGSPDPAVSEPVAPVVVTVPATDPPKLLTDSEYVAVTPIDYEDIHIEVGEKVVGIPEYSILALAAAGAIEVPAPIVEVEVEVVPDPVADPALDLPVITPPSASPSPTPDGKVA